MDVRVLFLVVPLCCYTDIWSRVPFAHRQPNRSDVGVVFFFGSIRGVAVPNFDSEINIRPVSSMVIPIPTLRPIAGITGQSPHCVG